MGNAGDHEGSHSEVAALTGLPNRRSLDAILLNFANQASVSDETGLALLKIDLDRFK